MRIMVIVKANADSEAGALPDAGMIERMAEFNNRLIEAGMMLDGAGLQASSAGARLRFGEGKPLVIDGPFAETKELIAGYWVIQARDMADAIAWMSRAPFADGEIELRPFIEPEAFDGVATPEVIAQEQGWREEQLAKAPKATA
ncbi:MAG: YciI family protein [Phenylobacterium sp.]|nr:MAG: YciI family protein [Phenylobacterium sp.]